MSERITLSPADSVSSAAFVEGINLAYRDYYRPLYFTPSSFRAMVEREAISLESSVVALDGKAVVGTALLGVRPPRGWIGGVGVVPARRRRGIGRAMMSYLLDQARALALEAVQLEVITINKTAQALYESLGFVTQRRLLFLTRQPGVSVPPPADNHFRCQARPANLALDLLPTLDHVTRAWSQDVPSLTPFVDLFEALVALNPGRDEPAGVCLYSVFPFHVSLATLAGSRPAGAALLDRLHSAHPDATVSYFNVPAADPLVPELRRTGYQETLAQFEMLRSTQN